MPFTLKESGVGVIVPDGRRGFAFLAEPVDGDDPIASRAASRLMSERCGGNRLVRQSSDLPMGLPELVDAIAHHAFFAIRLPTEFRRTVSFAQHDLLFPGWPRRAS